MRQNESFVTILSGDIDGNAPDAANNAYHVVTGSGTNSSASLDGFTITAGQAVDGGVFPNNSSGGSPTLNNIFGGGMYNEGSSPTLSNVIFVDNLVIGSDLTTGLGGGMSNVNGSSPTIQNSLFWNNFGSSGTGVGAITAAIFNDVFSAATINHSLVQGQNLGGTNLDGTVAGNGPQFVIPGDPNTTPLIPSNLRLQANSSVIDQGNNSFLPADTAALDNDGNIAEPLPLDPDNAPRIVDGDGDSTATVDLNGVKILLANSN